MKSKEDLLEEVLDQGARIVFAQHVLSGNRDDKVRSFISDKRYEDKLYGEKCVNYELMIKNKELQNQVSNLQYCKDLQEARIKGLNQEISSYKEKYETALKAIEELEMIIDKGHYVGIKRCCK